MAKQHEMTSRQFVFAIISFIQASIHLTLFIYPYTNHESWLVLVMSGMGALLLALVYAQLMKDYHSLSFFDMLEKAFGKAIGFALKALYVLFFIFLSSISLRFVTQFFIETMITHTPYHVVLICLALLCLWAASYDATAATRYGSLLVLWFFIGITISFFMLQPQSNPENLFPVFTLAMENYLYGSHISISVFFGETVCLLYLSKHVTPGKHSPRFYWIVGFLVGTISLTLSIYQDTVVLGRLMNLFTLPFFETFRAILDGQFFNRMEILLIYIVSMLLVNKNIMLFHTSVDSCRSLFKRPKSARIPWLVCAGIVLASYVLFPSMRNVLYYIDHLFVTIWTPFTVVIPVLTLVALKIREIAKKRVPQPA